MEDLVLPLNWLTRVGFPSGNPFSTREAAGEPESALVQYFIPHPAFYEIAGSAAQPRSSFLVARRGCGKTTSRRALEWQCRVGQMDAPVLAVSYLEFTRALGAAGASGRVGAGPHVVELLRLGLPRLLETIAGRPERARAFRGGLLEELALSLRRYTDLHSRVGLDRWLLRNGWLSDEANADALLGGRAPAGRPFFAFLAEMLAARPARDPARESAVDRLTRFVSQATLAGNEAVYFLVDRLDEREPMASSPPAAVNLIEELVTNLPLMELEGAAFKFFLTPEVMAALRGRPGFRPDRLLVRDIEWGEAELVELLDRRVKVFSNGRLPSLDVLAVDTNLVTRMAAAARGSPRNMLRLAEWVLYWQYKRVGEGGDLGLTHSDLAQALSSFAAEQPTGDPPPDVEEPTSAPPSLGRLRIDAADVLWCGGVEIGRLPRKQHLLLTHLLQNEGRVCTYDSLLSAIHGTLYETAGYTPDSIDKLVQRLRARLNRLAVTYPFFSRAADGRGYVLEQPGPARDREGVS